MAPARRLGLLLAARLLLAALSLAAVCSGTPAASGGNATDTWAVIVSSSRYWLNYRHAANALAVYQAVRRLGLPDSRILLMLADQPACSPRNPLPGQLFLAPGAAHAGGGASSAQRQEVAGNLLPADAEVDYRGSEVSVESILRVLTGRHPPGTPPSKRLLSGPNSNVLLYLTGHGGDEFLKLHDQEELLASDVASALAQMHASGRCGQLLLVADTCQASTLYGRIEAPHVLGVASSKLGQSSYAHHIDTTIGQHVVDQFTFYLHHFLTTRVPPPASSGSAAGGARGVGLSVPSLQQLLDFIRSQRMSSEVQVRADLFPHRLSDVPVNTFFGQGAAPAVPATPAAPAAQRRGSDADGTNAAQALLQRAAARRAAAAAPVTPSPWQSQLEQSGRSLFEAVEAAGAGSSPQGSRKPAASPAAVAGAWAAALAVSWWLLQGA
ncbi:hypothetical protein ABPG75_009666 [Micractinium tetrahymenae]